MSIDPYTERTPAAAEDIAARCAVEHRTHAPQHYAAQNPDVLTVFTPSAAGPEGFEDRHPDTPERGAA